MREAPIIQSVPRLGDHRQTSPSACVETKVMNMVGGKKITHLPKSAGTGASTQSYMVNYCQGELSHWTRHLS